MTSSRSAEQSGPAIITAFARVDGRPVGVIANQPMYMSGAIDNEASDKAARFVRFCDSFNTPLVFVVDTPGFMPGVEQEKGGIIKRGGRFLNAVVEADVPKVTITIRKSYGGAYAVMGSKQLTADLNFAWPTARIAVIGAEGAAQLLVKRFPDPTAPEVQKIRADFIEGYNASTGRAVGGRRARLHRRRDRAARDPAVAPQVAASAAGQADQPCAAQARPDPDLGGRVRLDGAVSNHLDDPRLDLCDLYVFQSPTDPSRTALILTANPEAGPLHPEAVYRFAIDHNGDLRNDIAFSFVFSEPFDDGRQTVDVFLAVGNEAGSIAAVGSRMFGDIPVTFGETTKAMASGGFVVLAPAPAGTRQAETNVIAMCLELPTSYLSASPDVRIWARCSLIENGEWLHADRAGHPSHSRFFLTDDDMKAAYNAGDPNRDRERWMGSSST